VNVFLRGGSHSIEKNSERGRCFIILFVASLQGNIKSQAENTPTMKNLQKKLEVEASHFGQIEVGGPFAGVEFHRQSGLPSRISFFSPVAKQP